MINSEKGYITKESLNIFDDKIERYKKERKKILLHLYENKNRFRRRDTLEYLLAFLVILDFILIFGRVIINA